MDHLGIDVHKQESQICILVEGGEPIERRIATTRERFTATLGGRPGAKILIEPSTESEWVARCLEDLGHEVISTSANRRMTNLAEIETPYAPRPSTDDGRTGTDKSLNRRLCSTEEGRFTKGKTNPIPRPSAASPRPRLDR